MLFHIHRFIGQSKYLKSQGISNLRLASRAVRGEPASPFSAALRAAESVGKIPESLIVVRLFDEIRTYFERNWRRASRAKLNARAGKKEGGWGEGIFARPRFPPPPNFVFRFAKCAARKNETVEKQFI